MSTAAPQYGHGLVGVAISGFPLFFPSPNGSPSDDAHAIAGGRNLRFRNACQAPGSDRYVLRICVARRLPGHDAVRGPAVEMRIADTTVRAFSDESVAAAALASGTRVLARSLKYHRPRTFFCFEGHCSGCLVRIGGVPNVRACLAPCKPGQEVNGQNAFPSAEIDLLGAVDFLFSRGMDHHTLMTSSSILNKLANKVVRQLSGLGKLPATRPDSAPPEVASREVDVCVIGAGPSGLAAAAACARGGRSTLLVDDQMRPGGSMRADPRTGRALAEARWADVDAAGAEVLARATAIGYFPEDGGGVLAVAGPTRLFRVHAKAWIWATGGYVVNLPIADNDRPGVIAARALGRLLVDHGILAGDKIALVEVPELAADTDALVAALGAAGAEVTRVPLARAVGVRGRGWAAGLDTRDGRVDCDLVAVAALPAPASEGARQHGCEVTLDAAAGGFRIVVDALGRTTTPGVWACGDVTGYMGPARAAEDGARVAAHVLGVG
jgi:sarcosine oxidase subunit alpha